MLLTDLLPKASSMLFLTRFKTTRSLVAMLKVSTILSSTSIINQEENNCSWICLQANLVEAFSQLWFLLLK